MSPLAICEMGVWVGTHNAEVVGGAVVHGVEREGGDVVAHDVEVVGGDAVVHGVEGEGGGAVAHGAEVVGGDVLGEGDGGVHGVVGEGDGGGVHGAVGEGGGGGVEVESDVVVQIVGVGGKTVEVGVCKVHVQNAAQEGNKVLAGNDHWVKSRHLGHHGIAMQDKENMFLSKPVGSMAMIKP